MRCRTAVRPLTAQRMSLATRVHRPLTHQQTTAPSRIATIPAGSVLRSETNGGFREIRQSGICRGRPAAMGRPCPDRTKLRRRVNLSGARHRQSRGGRRSSIKMGQLRCLKGSIVTFEEEYRGNPQTGFKIPRSLALFSTRIMNDINISCQHIFQGLPSISFF